MRMYTKNLLELIEGLRSGSVMEVAYKHLYYGKNLPGEPWKTFSSVQGKKGFSGPKETPTCEVHYLH